MAVVRFPRPRLVRIAGVPFYRSWCLAYSYSHAIFAGFDTVIAYAVWSPRGPRRVWAF